MGRAKRTSPTLENAEKRIAGIASVDAKLSFGDGLTLAAYRKAADETRSRLTVYNAALSKADEALDRLQGAEATLRDWSARMLSAVAAKYGKDSSEYEQAGGVRRSERKRAAPRTAEKKPTPKKLVKKS